MAIPNATAEQHGADLHTVFHKGDSIECPEQWERFWQHDVTEAWLSKKLKGLNVQPRLDDDDVRECQGHLREYLRKHNVAVGPLEPWYIPGKRPGWLPWQKDGFQACCALFPLFDFFSDTGACLKMGQDPINAAGLFAVSAVFLIASCIISTSGSLFFVLCSADKNGRRMNLSGDPTLASDLALAGEFERSKRVSLTQNVTKYFFLALLPALTNPESMKLLPWRDTAAVARFNGLPSVKCALFCTIAAVLEDVPQLSVQYVYSTRTTESLPWELQLS
eukprot:COSAG06_NODE_8_length_37897_cov_42.611884_1_plen_276_part_10